ncbi:hypothetical protein TRFO_27709 [Tritrichomonas foetus]|uniref:Leucine Rich Repeat family protein n=1 Tax=Tritrichomonas foetus TaxID=1144522 RepID=A0A1J4K173_9EUKA|nr:hypothetical protein TRFO_27709 [Tritrichomonas foetus]|eukprot:OHT04706.1 hypothetical protein TRFO_27709 [Tritrichomonas foetus]
MSSPSTPTSSPKPTKKFVTLNFSNSNIQTFESISFPENLFTLNLSNNEISDFTGLPAIETLRELIIDGNPIDSLIGAQFLPNLKYLSLKRSKIIRYSHFKIMCLIAFGSQIQTINDERINDRLRSISDNLRPKTLQKILKGYFIVRTNPLKLQKINSLNEETSLQQTSQNIPRNVASLCDQILNNEIPLRKKDVKKFKRKMEHLKRKYLPFDRIFEKNAKYSSDASFDNDIELRKVRLPDGIVFSDYYYSDSDEKYVRKDPNGLSISSSDDSIVDISFSSSSD